MHVSVHSPPFQRVMPVFLPMFLPICVYSNHSDGRSMLQGCGWRLIRV